MKDDAEQICDSIKQILFTYPGERTDQPDFGVGLQQYIFEPNTSDTRAAIQRAVRTGLKYWLGNSIEVEEVEVTMEESSITVAVMYKVIRTNQIRRDVFFQEI